MKTFLNTIAAFNQKAQFAVLWAKYDQQHTFMTDHLPEGPEAISATHTFSDLEALMMYWQSIGNAPEEMWYWIIDLRFDAPTCFCCGACDPGDIDILKEYFGLDAVKDYLTEEWR